VENLKWTNVLWGFMTMWNVLCGIREGAGGLSSMCFFLFFFFVFWWWGGGVKVMCYDQDGSEALCQ